MASGHSFGHPAGGFGAAQQQFPPQQQQQQQQFQPNAQQKAAAAQSLRQGLASSSSSSSSSSQLSSSVPTSSSSSLTEHQRFLAMVAESSQASRQPAVPRSQYVGVSMKTYCNRQAWQTTINVHGKAYHLGYFESETEAARHYDKYARANNKPVNFPVPHANPPEVQAVKYAAGKKVPGVRCYVAGGDVKVKLTSKYVGVYWQHSRQQWHIQIGEKRMDNRTGRMKTCYVHVGYSRDEEDAARLYDAQAALRSPPMPLNFPDDYNTEGGAVYKQAVRKHRRCNKRKKSADVAQPVVEDEHEHEHEHESDDDDDLSLPRSSSSKKKQCKKRRDTDRARGAQQKQRRANLNAAVGRSSAAASAFSSSSSSSDYSGAPPLALPPASLGSGWDTTLNSAVGYLPGYTGPTEI